MDKQNVEINEVTVDFFFLKGSQYRHSLRRKSTSVLKWKTFAPLAYGNEKNAEYSMEFHIDEGRICGHQDRLDPMCMLNKLNTLTFSNLLWLAWNHKHKKETAKGSETGQA